MPNAQEVVVKNRPPALGWLETELLYSGWQRAPQTTSFTLETDSPFYKPATIELVFDASLNKLESVRFSQKGVHSGGTQKLASFFDCPFPNLLPQDFNFTAKIKDVILAFNLPAKMFHPLARSAGWVDVDDYLRKNLQDIFLNQPLSRVTIDPKLLRLKYEALPAEQQTDAYLDLFRTKTIEPELLKGFIESANFDRKTVLEIFSEYSIKRAEYAWTQNPTMPQWFDLFSEHLSGDVFYKACTARYGPFQMAVAHEQRISGKEPPTPGLKTFKAFIDSLLPENDGQFTIRDAATLSTVFFKIPIVNSEARQELAEYSSLRALRAGAYNLIFSSPNAQLLECFQRVRGLPGELAYRAGNSDGALICLDSFENLDCNLLSKTILGTPSNVHKYCRVGLPRMEKLSFEIAERLLKYDRGTAVMRHLRSFELKRSEYQNLVKELIDRKQIEAVLVGLSDLPETVLQDLERVHYLKSYRSDLNVSDIEVYQHYCKLKSENRADEITAFCAVVKAEMTAIITGTNNTTTTGISPELLTKLRQRLIARVFPSHGVMHEAIELGVGNFERISAQNSFSQSSRLEKYKFKQEYRIDISEGQEVILKTGCTANIDGINLLEDPIRDAEKVSSGLDYDPARVLKNLEMKLAAATDLERFGTPLEKHLLVGFVGTISDPRTLPVFKRFLIQFQFGVDPHLRAYMQETVDRVGRSKNHAYAHLLEMREYYADRLRDLQAQLLSEWPKFVETIPELQVLYRKSLQQKEEDRRQAICNRFQAKNLGLSKDLLTRLEKLDSTIEDPNQRAKIKDNILLTARKRIAEFVGEITNKKVDYKEIDLENFNSQVFLDSLPIVISKPDEATLVNFVSGKFLGLFVDDIRSIDLELSKYQLLNEKHSRQMLVKAYFTLNSTAFFARRPAGVCVADDYQQWQQDNYLQLVFFDPKLQRCEGLVMLHVVEHHEIVEADEDAPEAVVPLTEPKKILVCSFNPSSTFLFKVNEQQFFNSIMDILQSFAVDNNFDYICGSASSAILTNRTGGEFQRAINERFSAAKQNIRLNTEQVFSFKPAYKFQQLKVLWRREPQSPENEN